MSALVSLRSVRILAPFLLALTIFAALVAGGRAPTAGAPPAGVPAAERVSDLFASPTPSAPVAPVATNADVNGLALFVQLGLVLAALYGAYRFAPRVLPRALRGQSASMRVVERLPLTRGGQLVIAEVDGARLLLGVTNEHIGLVVDLTQPERPPATSFAEHVA